MILGHQAIECTLYAGLLQPCSQRDSARAAMCESAIARKHPFRPVDESRRLGARADTVSMVLKGAGTA